MLAGLFFLGVIAATAMPDVVGLLRGSADAGPDEDGPQDDGGEGDRAGSDGGSLLDLMHGVEGAAADAEADPDAGDGADADSGDDGGVDLFAEPQPGSVTTVEAFRPGADTLTLRVPEGATGFGLHEAAPGESPGFGYTLDGQAVSVRFEGLDTVPVGDVFLRMPDTDAPGHDSDVALGQLLPPPAAEADDGSAAGGDALQPVDPELPDLPPEPTSAADPVLDPVDPELPDDPPPPVHDPVHDPAPDPVVVLDPVDPELPDTPAPPPDGATGVLDPVDDTQEIPEGGAELAGLVLRDGGDPTGLDTAGPAADLRGDGDETVQLPSDGGGAPGRLAFSEAMPVLVPGDGGAAVTVTDLGGGDDVFQAGDGPAYGFGGAGDDTMTGGSGAAALYGGDGSDALSAGQAPSGAALLHGGAGDDLLTGSAGADHLDGGEHGTAAAGGGADTILGYGGDDVIRGGLGADVLSGGDGSDLVDHRGTDAERIVAEHSEHAWHIDGAPDDLDGGSGDDTLIFDGADRATGGGGSDVFWLYSDAVTGVSVAEVTDFTPGEDFLRISLNPHGGATGNVDVVGSEDGADGLVRIDGVTVAVLRGAPMATVGDIYVEIRPDVFP
ncbi:calcium-binding protein [Oceaniglobus roseus]|uniref:calcium-binding protein n=1 Tax=Oceaniglobus roseus TaxID=1737570 RepID=UPI000C7F6CC2|nr:calcium-binding protein [Kandeliimicrobium roseum]